MATSNEQFYTDCPIIGAGCMTKGASSRRVAIQRAIISGNTPRKRCVPLSIQNPKEKETFIELARTWTVAAVQSEQSYAVACESYSQPMWRIAPVGRVHPQPARGSQTTSGILDSLPASG